MPSDLRARLERSERFIHEIRAFFSERGHVEVDTPCLAPYLIPEPAIAVFATEFHPAGASVPLFLAPSPELWMKRLIAAGSGSIFQVARAFRDGDYGGPLHNPEFRLLEWYTVGASYLDQVAATEELLARLIATDPPHGSVERLQPPFRLMTMAEAFQALAGLDLARLEGAPGALIEVGRSRGVDARNDWTWEQAFHGVFLAAVEPRLPRDRPLVLSDWPAAVPTTAQRRAGTPWAERWELYLDGVEVANCYTEETDPAVVSRFLADEAARQRTARVVPRVDEGYRRLFADGFPVCSGVALGVDRLEMVFRGQRSLEGVINFPLSAIVRG